MLLGQPFHQRARSVQADLQRRIAAKEPKRAIAVLIRLLEDSVEIADRLMIVGTRARRIGCDMGSAAEVVSGLVSNRWSVVSDRWSAVDGQ
jgi:hypothetical protein